MATITQVAHLAGVSTATVSYVVNQSVPVSPETRERVMAAIRELDYHPSSIARNLQRRTMHTLGFVLPYRNRPVSDPFILQFLAGVSDEAAQQGFDLLLSVCAPGEGESEVYRRLVRGRRVDGLIVTDTRCHDERITYLHRHQFPFVTFGRCSQESSAADCPYVDVDGARGVAEAVAHLVACGHRRIAYIGLPAELVCAGHRLAGYTQGLAGAGLPWDESLVQKGDLTQHSGYLLAKSLLELATPPTAIIAGSDLMALGVINAVQEQGLRVGEDVAVAGFDDTPLAEHARPSLTTLRQPTYDIGQQVCHLLIQLVKGEQPAECQILINPTLIVRDSTRRISGE